MRLRKIKYAKDFIEENNHIVITEPTNHASNWHSLFGNSNPIHIEVGCGKGQFIIEMAKKHPEINFIGIEKYDSVIIRGLEKYLDNPLENVLFIQKDAANIEAFFSKNEVDVIYLNFSDPWPKKRQEKRRLSHTKFLNQYYQILNNNGYIQMKTDNFGLFDYSMMSFHRHPAYWIEDISLDYHHTKENIPTEFEEKFVALGNSIYFLKVLLMKEQ